MSNNNIIKKHIDQLNFDLKRGFVQFVTLHLIYQTPRYTHEIKDEISKKYFDGSDFNSTDVSKYSKLFSGYAYEDPGDGDGGGAFPTCGGGDGGD